MIILDHLLCLHPLPDISINTSTNITSTLSTAASSNVSITAHCLYAVTKALHPHTLAICPCTPSLYMLLIWHHLWPYFGHPHMHNNHHPGSSSSPASDSGPVLGDPQHMLWLHTYTYIASNYSIIYNMCMSPYNITISPYAPQWYTTSQCHSMTASISWWMSNILMTLLLHYDVIMLYNDLSSLLPFYQRLILVIKLLL